MKILEVRDGFIKIESDSPIYLSSLLHVQGDEKCYIAQIIHQKNANNKFIGYAKILYLYDGSILPYDKTLPSENAEIRIFTSDILENSIDYINPIIVGKTLDTDSNIIIDSSNFDKKMLISVDDKAKNNLLVRNISKQFHNIKKKIIVIDTLGVIQAKKVIAGKDFKVPLDTRSLSFMYQDCLNDATSDSKSLIIEIFKDLAEYSETVPFVPFGALKSIVDEMVDKSHIFKLLVLKNKLAKFDKLGYFAKDKQEVDRINKVLNSDFAVIDLSKLNTAFQTRYIDFIYEKINKIGNTQILFELSNTVSKKSLKHILSNKQIPTTIITHSRFKYIEGLQKLFKNFIFTPSIVNNKIFYSYNSLLKEMKENTYLVTGEASNNIPVISAFKIIDDIAKPKVVENNAILEELANEEHTEEPIEDSTEDENIINEQEECVEPDVIDEDNLNDNQDNEIVAKKIKENEAKKEEILANIDEKSDSIIFEAAQNLTRPTSMFSDDKEEGDDNIVEQYANDNEENVDIENNISEDNITTNTEQNLSISNDEAITDNIEIDTIEENNNEVEDDANSLLEALEEDEDAKQNQIQENIVTEETNVESVDDTTQLIDINANEENTENIDEEDVDIDIENNTLDLSNEDLSSQENTTIDINYDDIVEEVEIPDGLDFSEEFDDENTNINLEESNTENITAEISDDNIQEETMDVLPISEDEDETNFEEIIELDPNETDENDIIIDIDDNPDTVENIDEQIVQDVDKVFTTRKDNDISDSDLDLIDEINNEENEDMLLEEVSDNNEYEELEELSDGNNSDEDGILEEINDNSEDNNNDSDDGEILETRNSSTPIVPVYDAEIPQEDVVASDPIEQGDSVTHAKYGNGVVEKMIKYGNKTLYSINFENVGRRLLDPTLTEIKKN